MCDYCIDKKKFENSEFKEVIPHNVFFLILELVKKLDDRFGFTDFSMNFIWKSGEKNT